MALEQWSLEKLEAGAVFEDVFRKVIEGNDSVAALGVGVSLCLAQAGASLECAFPMLTCPYLWEWDIARVIQDASPANQIGNWYHDRIELSAVRKLNEKSHRKYDIRHLVPYFVFSGDKAVVTGFRTAFVLFRIDYQLATRKKTITQHISRPYARRWFVFPSRRNRNIGRQHRPPTASISNCGTTRHH